MTDSNFRTYVGEAHPLPFDRNRGILIVQTPNALTTETLAHRFRTTIMRTIRDLQLAFDGIPVQDVQFESRL